MKGLGIDSQIKRAHSGYQGQSIWLFIITKDNTC